MPQILVACARRSMLSPWNVFVKHVMRHRRHCAALTWRADARSASLGVSHRSRYLGACFTQMLLFVSLPWPWNKSQAQTRALRRIFILKPRHNRLFCTVREPAWAQTRRAFLRTLGTLSGGLLLSSLLSLRAPAAVEALQGVNRPDLLPSGPVQKLIDRERFLVSGQRRRLQREIDALEEACGVKFRILTQRYPETPGLAIKDYWGVDANTVVMVVDYFGGVGNVLKFNIGANVDKSISPRFWSRISSKYGNKFYLEEKGIDQAILSAFEEAAEEIRSTCKDAMI